MNDYVINPMWFYLLQVVDGIQCVFFIVAILSAIVLIVCGIIAFALYVDDCYECESEKIIKCLKPTVLILVISMLLVVFIPSKQTLIEMEIAKHATYSNVESVKEQIKDAADYILDRLEGDNDGKD